MDFSRALIQWYRRHKRDLPWRNTSDPYKVWLSEIILQQTRVDQGMSYYEKFVDHFPTVNDLAQSTEDQVLKLWQGLGYYSRARNLHATSKMVVNNYNSQFPNSYKDLLKLKGVGPYTAAAIASFCFGEAKAVVDGNVYRVLARIYGEFTPIDSTAGKKLFQQKADEVIDNDDPGEHNQAMMEFGATHCTPKNPDCDSCPFNKVCIAHRTNQVAALPQKSKKQKVKHVFFNYLVFSEDDHIWLRKRSGNGIWKNLHDFPLIESEVEKEQQWLVKESNEKYGRVKDSSNPIPVEREYTHVLSHRKIHARFYVVNSQPQEDASEKLIRVHKSKLDEFAIPRLIENFVNDHPELF
ncbi:A/G-specific adenine glycosylase [Halocola ammonii]